MRNAARSVAEARRLHEQVHGRGNLLADRADAHVGVGHAHHHLQAAQTVARRVGVNRGERSVVARIHGLQHVQRFFRPDLAHDDAVGAHTEGINHQLPDVNRARALDVGGPGFHARHVRLLQPQFGRVFDGHDALVFRDIGGKRVEQRRLAGTRTAADQDVQARLDAAFQQFQHTLGHGQLGYQVFALHGVAAKTADGKQRAVHRYRRNGRVNARSVGKAGVHQRRRFVHAPTHARHHLLNDAHQVLVVFELHRRAVQFAGALHVDQVRPGHQDVRYRRILQQRLQRSQAEYFVQNFLDVPVFLHQAERRLLFLHQLGDGRPDFRAHALARHRRQRLQVDPVQQFAMQRELQFLVFRRRSFTRE